MLTRYVARACGSSVTNAALLGIASRIEYNRWESRRTVAALPSFRIYSLRRKIAERFANKYSPERVTELGPDLACLEWLMESGATEVQMNDGERIGSIAEMRKYLDHALSLSKDDTAAQSRLLPGDLSFEKKWPNAPRVHIVKVDASDSAIANPGFPHFRDLRRLEALKLNFCDYFGDEALRELAMGSPATTLKDIEIVLNPCVTDGAVYWLSRLKALRRAHFYFLPYVTNRKTFLRQLKTALPKCDVTFPEVDKVGYGYDEKN